MKLTTTLVCALTVLAFSTGAWAENDDWAETTDLAEEVDWEEAIEFAEVTDTFVENGVKWVTYYDELQQVMWSQPEDASSEAALAYLSGDQETLKDMGLDSICVFIWPTPTFIAFIHSNSGGAWDILTAGDYDATLTGSSSTTKTWTYYDNSYVWYEDLDGAAGRVESSGSYCNNYRTRLSKQMNDETGWITPQSDNCFYDSFTSKYYISGSDVTTVQGWSGIYENQNKYVSYHRFYACSSYRYVYQRLRVYWLTK